MRPTLYLLLLLLLASCQKEQTASYHFHSNDSSTVLIENVVFKTPPPKHGSVEVFTIDGCDYILYSPDLVTSQSGVSIIHKANCKNHK